MDVGVAEFVPAAELEHEPIAIAEPVVPLEKGGRALIAMAVAGHRKSRSLPLVRENLLSVVPKCLRSTDLQFCSSQVRETTIPHLGICRRQISTMLFRLTR